MLYHMNNTFRSTVFLDIYQCAINNEFNDYILHVIKIILKFLLPHSEIIYKQKLIPIEKVCNITFKMTKTKPLLSKRFLKCE